MLDHTRPNADHIYVQVNAEKRVKLDTRPLDRAFMQIGFVDRDGKRRMIRLKLACDSIEQKEQIQLGFPANEKFTQEEYGATTFRHGVLVTADPIVQTFMDTTPQNEAFWIKDKNGKRGSCNEIKGPLFKEYNKSVITQNEYKEFELRLKAANRIMELDLKGAQELMIRINGSSFTPPEDIMECKTQLIKWMDGTDEKGLEALIREEDTPDEEVTLLVVKAIKHDIISFETGQVTKIKNNANLKLKEIPEELGEHDSQRYFVDFLLSDSGKAILADLRKDVAAAEE